MFNIIANIAIIIILAVIILILAVKLLWNAVCRGKISREKVFKELQKRLDLSDDDVQNLRSQADQTREQMTNQNRTDTRPEALQNVISSSPREEKFGKRTYRHYKVSKDFLLKVYEQNDGRLEFVDRYQLKWSTLRNKVAVIVGTGAATISTIWNICTIVSANISSEDGNIDIMKTIGNTISNIIPIIKPETIELFGGIFILVILIFVMSFLVWKVGNEGFYDKIIKEILEENSESGNAE